MTTLTRPGPGPALSASLVVPIAAHFADALVRISDARVERARVHADDRHSEREYKLERQRLTAQSRIWHAELPGRAAALHRGIDLLEKEMNQKMVESTTMLAILQEVTREIIATDDPQRRAELVTLSSGYLAALDGQRSIADAFQQTLSTPSRSLHVDALRLPDHTQGEHHAE